MRLETEYAMMQGEPGKDGVDGTNGKDGTDGKDGQMLYAICNTESETQEKTAALVDGILTLVAGTSVAVKFTHANTTSEPMLNIAGTGAKDMYIQGVRDVYWSAGATVTFTYDGENWRVASEPVYGPTATIGNAAGYNVYIDGTSVTVRQGEEVLAVFEGKKIELGNAAKRAEIYLGDYLQIGAYEYNDDGVAGYIKGEAVRISTKTPDESGQGSVPSIIVNGEDVFINKKPMSQIHEWTLLKNQSSVGNSTLTVDLSLYSEFMITCGCASSSNGNYYRALGTTIVPKSVLISATNVDHGNGAHQAMYDTYQGGISYLGNNKIKVYNKMGIARLYAR